MPEMNGFEATSQIRSMGFQMPIIAVTANALKGEMEKCIQVGMNDFITKPFKRMDLISVINRVWRQEKKVFIQQPSLPIEKPKPVLDFNQEVLFDYAEALSTFLNNKELVSKLSKSFLEKAEQHGRAIEEAIQSGDYEKAFQQAHAVKGSALNLGAQRLGKIAQQLEAMGREKDIETCRDLLPYYKKTLSDLREYVRHTFP